MCTRVICNFAGKQPPQATPGPDLRGVLLAAAEHLLREAGHTATLALASNPQVCRPACGWGEHRVCRGAPGLIALSQPACPRHVRSWVG